MPYTTPSRKTQSPNPDPQHHPDYETPKHPRGPQAQCPVLKIRVPFGVLFNKAKLDPFLQKTTCGVPTVPNSSQYPSVGFLDVPHDKFRVWLNDPMPQYPIPTFMVALLPPYNPHYRTLQTPCWEPVEGTDPLL